jgi:hypothetical protein
MASIAADSMFMKIAAKNKHNATPSTEAATANALLYLSIFRAFPP